MGDLKEVKRKISLLSSRDSPPQQKSIEFKTEKGKISLVSSGDPSPEKGNIETIESKRKISLLSSRSPSPQKGKDSKETVRKISLIAHTKEEVDKISSKDSPSKKRRLPLEGESPSKKLKGKNLNIHGPQPPDGIPRGIPPPPWYIQWAKELSSLQSRR